MSTATLLVPAAALAEGDADVIIVTGTSIEQTLPQELARYGNDLNVMTDETVRDRGAVDLATALDAVPGLYIRPGSGPFSYVDLSLQGSRSADVLWTVDGVRINNRLYAGTSPNDTIPASLIERVEVLKGGESLFYGTQAVAGVINVVTRDFTADWNGQVNGSVDSRAGTTLDGYVRGSAGGHRFVAWGSRNRAAGYRPFNVLQPSATDRRRGYRHWSAGGKYQVDLADGLHLSLHGETGAVVRAIDRDGRAFRWLHHGLHSLDVPVLRLEPVRAIVVLPLLAGVTLVCGTGTWMGFSRIRRDLAGRRRRRRHGAAARPAVAA